MSDERARLFVALELPAEARDALESWRSDALREHSGLRPVGTDALHVTLCFLGWRLLGEAEPISTALAGVTAHDPACLSFGDSLWLPPRRPRVLAVELRDEGGMLGRVQATISAALHTGGWYAPEPRPFLAHVTVARVVKGARVRGLELPAPPALRFGGAAVTLFRSHLGSGGARYEPLHTVRLGSGEPPSDPISVVHRFHAAQAAAYAGEGLDGLRAVLHEDVVWHVPGRSAIAGEHLGLQAVLAYLEQRRQMTDSTFRVRVHGAALIGDRVVQLAAGRAVRASRPVDWETVGVFRVADGRVAECWLIPFDLYQFDEIWS